MEDDNAARKAETISVTMSSNNKLHKPKLLAPSINRNRPRICRTNMRVSHLPSPPQADSIAKLDLPSKTVHTAHYQ